MRVLAVTGLLTPPSKWQLIYAHTQMKAGKPAYRQEVENEVESLGFLTVISISGCT